MRRTQFGAHRGGGPGLALLAIVLAGCGPKAGSETTSTSSATVASRSPITELDSSVIPVGEGDWSTDRCVDMVARAARYTQSRIMFVPTLFWVQDGDGPVDHYCYDRQQQADGTWRCTPADEAAIQRFKDAMQRCFQRAVDAGLSIALTPHLDDGLGQGRWRNILVFDPLRSYGGHSYADVVLYPLADALSAVARPGTKIYFGMQGEMSATVFREPASWRSLAGTLKDRIAAGHDPAFRENVKVGLSTNFNKLCGCVGLDIIDPAEYVSRYPALWEQVKGQFDLDEIAKLYDAVDYLGMSSYPSLYPNFPTSEIENALSQFDFEFSYFGLSINDLARKGKEVHFSEYGVGGGISQNGDRKATDARGAALYPFFGIFGAYRRATDPWALYDLGQPSATRDYLRYFYGKTLEYLRNGTRYKYRVDAAFLWNQASWDIQAIYPESTSSEGSYRDPVVVDMINAHNRAAMNPGPLTCTDIPPPGNDFTCAQQAGWGKCDADFMIGYCDASCNRCSN